VESRKFCISESPPRTNHPERAAVPRIRHGRNDLDANDEEETTGGPHAARLGDPGAARRRRKPQSEEHGWMQDRGDPYTHERALEVAGQDPPSGVSPEDAVAEVRGVLDWVSDTCPDCLSQSKETDAVARQLSARREIGSGANPRPRLDFLTLDLDLRPDDADCIATKQQPYRELVAFDHLDENSGCPNGIAGLGAVGSIVVLAARSGGLGVVGDRIRCPLEGTPCEIGPEGAWLDHQHSDTEPFELAPKRIGQALQSEFRR
jgi:hypothetical protein